METVSDNKALQLEAVREWMKAINQSRVDPPREGDEASLRTINARYAFCRVIASALHHLIRDMDENEDGLVYAMVVFGQIVGVRAAIAADHPEDGFRLCVAAGQHMIEAYYATIGVKPDEPSVVMGAIH